MARVASLFLPQLAIERLRRAERPPSARPEPPVVVLPPVDADPGACSVPRGGGWRPGASWSRRPEWCEVERRIEALPAHQRPSVRELGRRSEAAEHPFRRPAASVSRSGVPPGIHAVSPGPWTRPLVLVAAAARRQLVSAVCPAARDLGLVVGMPATQARALVPDLDVRPADPDADAALLARLALHAATHWTPTAAPSGGDGLWLDLGGVAHLHGGEERFCRRLVAFCARAGLTARLAVAGTPGAAHALARFGETPVVIADVGWDREMVEPLPLAALRLAPETLATAARFGFERVADVAGLPRGPLAKRLGLDAVRRLDQALGDAPEPIEGVVPFEAPAAELRLLEPIGTPEQVALVATDLTELLVEALRERGVGLRAARLAMLRVDGEEQAVTIGTARATRDPSHIVRLLGFRLDRIDPGLGLEAGRLVATRVEPLPATPLGMTVGAGRVADPALLVDRLTARVGGGAVYRASPVASYVPERSVARASPLAAPAGWPVWRRPARLLARPEPLHDVLALLPDHPPRRFTWRGRSHRVIGGDGPERIAGEWWRRGAEETAVRDYFLVEDDAGARFWLFRRGDGVDPATGDLGWWMHGIG